MTALTLHHEFTLSATVEAAQMVGAGPYGMRMVVPVTTGTVVGERLNGTVVGPGADWVLVGGDGMGRVDVRLQIRTDDDVLVFAHYEGLLELNGPVITAIADSSIETQWGDQYFRTNPRFEVGDDRYTWLQQSLFVARGRITKSGIEYEVFRVE